MKLKGFNHMNHSLLSGVTPENNSMSANFPNRDAYQLNQGLFNSMESYRKDLKFNARRLIGPRMRERFDSSDLVQETLLVTVSKLSEVVGKPEKIVFKWMMGVMRNRLMHHAREIHNHATFNELKTDTPDPKTPEQSSALFHEEIRARVMGNLQKMSTLEQTVFHLRYQEELSLYEISQRTGKTEAAVRGLLFRVVMKLRHNLGEEIN